jgi:hypothetical protein
MENNDLNLDVNIGDDKIDDTFLVIGKEDDSFIESYVASSESESDDTRFFVIIEVLNDETEADEIADSLVETFRKHYYEESNLDPYARFEEALKFVNDVARDIQSNGVPLHQLNVAIAALDKDILYLSQANDAEVYLVRGGTCSNISEGLSVGKRREHSDLFENIATGNLEKNDVVLFSSARLIRYISQNDLARCFHYKGIKKGVLELDDSIKMDVLGRVGVLALKVKEDLVEKEVLSESEISSVASSKRVLYILKAKKYFKITVDSVKEIKNFLYGFFSGKGVKFHEIKNIKGVSIISGATVFLIMWFILSATGVLATPSKRVGLELVEQTRSIISSARSEEDRDRATQMIFNAESKIAEISEIRRLQNQAAELEAELVNLKSVVDGLISLSDLPIYADISTKRSDANIFGLYQILNNYFAVDSSRAYEFIGDLVKDPINVTEGSRIKDAAPFLDVESMVFLTEDNRIREYFGGIVKFMETEDGAYKPADQVLTYGSRLYLLDKEEGQVWRYSRRRDSYGRAEPSLANIDNEKVKNAVSFAIDGSIYLLYPNGNIDKYFAGSEVTDFRFESRPISTIRSANFIYTNANFPFVMVMESETRKIYQFFKDPRANNNLVYLRQYYFEDLSELTGFIVDLANRRLLVSDKSKVYVTDFLN